MTDDEYHEDKINECFDEIDACYQDSPEDAIGHLIQVSMLINNAYSVVGTSKKFLKNRSPGLSPVSLKWQKLIMLLHIQFLLDFRLGFLYL